VVWWMRWCGCGCGADVVPVVGCSSARCHVTWA
jgi:hypothetical protein